MSSIIFAAAAGILVFTLYWIAMTALGKKDSVTNRVNRLTPDINTAQEEIPALTLEPDKSSFSRVLEGILTMIQVDVAGYRRKNELRFYQAGMQNADAIIYYLFFKRIMIFPIAIGAILLMTIDAEGGMRLAYVLSGIMTMVLAVLGPDLYISNGRQKRQKILVRSFPDTLDLLLVCVESGLALDGAMSRVCKELGRAHPEMTTELNRTRMELTLLNDRSKALQNLADRTDMVPFRSLVATLLQSEKFGTSLTDTLRVLSEDFRMSRLLAAENKAGQLPALMTIPLICFMLPAFFMIIMGPAALQLFNITQVK